MSAIGQVGSMFTSGSGKLHSSSAGQRGRPPEPSAEMKAQFEAKFESAAKDLGIDVSSFKELRGKIDDAVKSARESGASSRSDIDQAVDSVLKDSGVDAAEFKSQMSSIFEKMGMPKPGQGGFPAGGSQQGGSLSLLDSLPVGSFLDAAA